MSALVRFERSHADDDEHVAFRHGPYPGREAYLQQLVEELADGEFDRDLTLVLWEPTTHDSADTYRMYVRMPLRVGEDAVLLAQRLQHAYDVGGAAGWFQVIEP